MYEDTKKAKAFHQKLLAFFDLRNFFSFCKKLTYFITFSSIAVVPQSSSKSWLEMDFCPQKEQGSIGSHTSLVEGFCNKALKPGAEVVTMLLLFE